MAADNARRLKLGNVVFEHGDWYAGLGDRRFDVIVSNPPYIADNDAHLGRGDLRFEPRTALASGPDGLNDIRRIVAGAHRHLRPGAWLLIEHGWDQGEAVRGLFAEQGFTEIIIERDLEQRDRVTMGKIR